MNATMLQNDLVWESAEISCKKCAVPLRFSGHGKELEEQMVVLLEKNGELMLREELDRGEEDDGVENLDELCVLENVWENQLYSNEKKWAYDGLELIGFGPFSDERGTICGSDPSSILAPLPLDEIRNWKEGENWTPDSTLPTSDEDGWIYTSSISQFGSFHDFTSEAQLTESEEGTESPPPVSLYQAKSGSKHCARRRRLTRKRVLKRDSDQAWASEFVRLSSALSSSLPYPMCNECELLMRRSLESENLQLQEELDHYEDFRKDFEEELSSCVGGHISVIDNNVDGKQGQEFFSTFSVEELERMEAELRVELHKLNVDRQHVSRLRGSLHELVRSLDYVKDEALREVVGVQLSMKGVLDELYSVNVYHSHAQETLGNIQRYHVLNDVFHIWHDGQFGTINGLKLGRLPSRPVEWVEINAALGQTALLLATISERIGFHPQSNAQILPRGSYSRIRNGEGKEYALFSEGSFMKRRGFNHAMTLLLDYIDQTSRFVYARDNSQSIPYRISKGRIGELSISMGDDEEWTRALKYMLTVLKWVLSWMAKHRL